MVCLGNKQIILSFLRLHPSTAFWTLLLTTRTTSFFSKGLLTTVIDIMVIWMTIPIPIHFSSLISKMSVFTLVISCLTTSNLFWLMGFPGVLEMVKNPPAMWETWVWSLGWEELLEEGWQPTPVLPGESPWAEKPGGLQSIRSQRIGHDWATKHSTAHTDLTFPVPFRCCSLQHQTLLSPPDWALLLLWLSFFIPSKAISPLFSSSILGTYQPGEFIFQYPIFLPFLCSWGSQGKDTEVVSHSLLQWTTFCQNSPPWPILLGWPYMAWLIVSLS